MDLIAGRVWADERRPIRHLDPVLLVTSMLLSVVGLFLVYSATNRSLRTLRLDPGQFVKKQFTALVLGFVLLVLVAAFDYRFYKVYAGFIYAATVVALVLVQTPLGASPSGAQRWFTFGGFQLTPSEFAKIALALMLAAVLSELRAAEPALSDVLRVTMIAAVPMGLVFIQPDIGTTIVLVAILVGTLVVAGTRPRHLATLALASIVLLFGAFQLNVIKGYQLDRIHAFLDSGNDSQGANYNRNQAEIAIGSGGLVGQGYLSGRLTNLDFVPEQHTDFIFTVAGEEFGFVGAAFILALFAILMWRAIRIAYLSKDAFGTYVASGIAAMFAIQMFVNVGMVIGIMPITGIPLPFVSYGGSSMLANFIAVGLLLNIHMRRFT
ncbi:MAG: rod shape-determining protein RodA [Actinomycetota bacterium]|nr:rod shape-determining protein RodA [Actinomycetota bacterium]